MKPYLPMFSNGVALIGEALGENEAEEGAPFCGKAGFKLTRLVEFAGFNRSDFTIFNAAWCRPPDNKLDNQWYESSSISHCRANHWASLLQNQRVLVPMGNVATNAILGFKGILKSRGYIYPGQGYHVIPTVHPSFIARGQSKWSAAFINDLQKAVSVARDGVKPTLLNYTLDPSPMEAYLWAKMYLEELARNPSTYLAFDIETPGKDEDEDDVDLDSDAPDRTWNIERIGFAYKPHHALSIPWAPEYRAAVAAILGSSGAKVVWNAGFDVPRIRRTGTAIAGLIHDGMVAWHILHSDLPKRLGFVATFTCPYQPAWKHLSGARPAFYNATDADVEFRSMVAIESSLRSSGLWDVYQRDVLDLEPILVHMHDRGMPVDAEIRLDRAIKLDSMLTTVKSEMSTLIPPEARRIDHVYRNKPADCSQLQTRPSTRLIQRCSSCGLAKPRKDHFKRYVKKTNPCAGGGVLETEEVVEEYFRWAEFAPSRTQLIQYHQVLHRACPTTWDKKQGKRKVSFGEREITALHKKFPNDALYPKILIYRSLEKIASSYIGRIDEP